MRVAGTITLSAQEEQTLQKTARSKTVSMREVRRAQIVLLAAAGKDNQAIAADGRRSRGTCRVAVVTRPWMPR